jgi:predicted DNA-binding ribbon-helix-helix protein
MTLSELVGEIDNNRQQGNLSSAIRLFVLDYFKHRASVPAEAKVPAQ